MFDHRTLVPRSARTRRGATAYGFLAQVLWAPGSRRLREAMERTRNLPAFCERMKQTFYAADAAADRGKVRMTA